MTRGHDNISKNGINSYLHLGNGARGGGVRGGSCSTEWR